MKSIVEKINENIFVNKEDEVQMMINNGKSFDSLFEKWHEYNHKYGKINESYRDFYNISLTIDEQNAAKSLLTTICESYIESLQKELLDETLNEGLKDKLKEIRDKASEKIKNIKTKIEELNKFLKDIANKAIQSIKELVHRINEMMIKLGENLSKLVEKLGGDEESSLKTLEAEVQNAMNDEKTSKENIYENYALELQNAIDEGLFDRFKRKNKEDKEDKGKKTDDSKDEYDDAIDQKNGKVKGGKLWKVIGNIVLQMFAYYGVTIILPAIITLIGGPVAGAIAAAIAKILWSSFTIYKQVQREFKIRKKPDGEYHSYPKWRKIVHNILFAVSIIGSTAAGITGIKDGVKIIDALKSNSKELIKQILPPESVQNVLKFIDKNIKSLDGIKGYDELVAAQEKINNGFVELQKAIPEKTELMAAKEMGPEEVKKIQDVINNEMQGVSAKDWVNTLKDKFDSIKGEFEKGYTYATGNVKYDGGIQAVLKTSEGQEFLSKYGDLFKYTPVQSANSAGTTYSCILQFKEGLPQTKEAVEAFSELLKNAGNGTATILGSVANATKTVSLGIAAKLANVIGVVGTDIPFGGLFPIASKGPNFRVRLGSNRTGNSGIYEIQEKKEMTIKECKEEYGEKNPKVFAQMEKQINKNYKELQDWKAELEKDKDANKKEIKNIDKTLDKMKNAVEDYKLLVFLGIPVKKSKKNKEDNTEEPNNESRYTSLRNYIWEAEESTEESTEENTKENTEEKTEEKTNNSSEKKQPVFFINPMLMGCGDLANRSASKGPRNNLYYFKGLLSSIEILPIPGGASQKEIIDMFIHLMTESIKANLNMVPDKPCTKDGKKYIVNHNSKKTGNRKDFGDFTNEEITEIINNKKEAGKYLGGKYKTSRNSTIEKNDTVENETHNKKVKAEFKKYIEENDKIKEFLSKHKKLKKFLIDDEGKVKDSSLDEISDLISRSEAAYLQGKEKKGLFAKIKSWFKGENENDELSKIDPDDLSTLSLMIHQLRKKDGKMKKESLIHPLYTDDMIDESLNEDLLFESNMEMIIDEFNEWLSNEEMFDEPEPLI